jgi:hypothetical protein
MDTPQINYKIIEEEKENMEKSFKFPEIIN